MGALRKVNVPHRWANLWSLLTLRWGLRAGAHAPTQSYHREGERTAHLQAHLLKVPSATATAQAGRVCASLGRGLVPGQTLSLAQLPPHPSSLACTCIKESRPSNKSIHFFLFQHALKREEKVGKTKRKKAQTIFYCGSLGWGGEGGGNLQPPSQVLLKFSR